MRTSLFVDLNGGLVVFDSNDLTDEVLVTDTNLAGSITVHSDMAHTHTSSYIAHPIMFSAMMTGLGGSVYGLGGAI